MILTGATADELTPVSKARAPSCSDHARAMPSSSGPGRTAARVADVEASQSTEGGVRELRAVDKCEPAIVPCGQGQQQP